MLRAQGKYIQFIYYLSEVKRRSLFQVLKPIITKVGVMYWIWNAASERSIHRTKTVFPTLKIKIKIELINSGHAVNRFQ